MEKPGKQIGTCTSRELPPKYLVMTIRYDIPGIGETARPFRSFLTWLKIFTRSVRS